MSALKLLHAADLHLDSPFESLSGAAAEKRRALQRELPKKIADAAERLGAQVVLLSGDVFESDAVSLETQHEFCRSFGALGCPVLVSPGNHDPYFAGCVWQRMTLPENVHVFTGGIESVEFPDIDARFYGAAFTADASEPMLKGFAAERADKPNVMVIHGEVCSGESKYNAVSRADLENCGMDFVALGHIHAASGLQSVGGVFYLNPGCAEGRGYDELGETGAALVTLSEEGVSAEFVPLGGVRYEIITLDITDAEPVSAAVEAVSGLTDRDFCRLIFTGETETPLDLAAVRNALSDRLCELQLRDETTLKRDLWALGGEDTLKGVFIDRLKQLYDGAGSQRQRELIEKAAAYGVAAMENEGDKL